MSAHDPQQDPPVAQVVITLHQSGKVAVAGPIENKLVCLGLIESAKHAIHNFQPQPASALILPRLNHG